MNTDKNYTGYRFTRSDKGRNPEMSDANYFAYCHALFSYDFYRPDLKQMTLSLTIADKRGIVFAWRQPARG
jgi:hypothetical protein